MALQTKSYSPRYSSVVAHEDVRLRFPKEVDTRAMWAFINAMGWMQYVQTEPKPRQASAHFFDAFKSLPCDNTPYEDLREQMYQEKYGF